jgi:hypothetical protein
LASLANSLWQFFKVFFLPQKFVANFDTVKIATKESITL